MILIIHFTDGGKCRIMSKIINSILLKNYRGFKDECTLSLAEKNNLTLLVGPNNSGKSLIARIFSVFRVQLTDSHKNIFEINHFQDSDFHNLDVNSPVLIKLNINTQSFEGRTEPELVWLSKISNVDLCIEIRKVDNRFLGCVFISDGENHSHQFNEELNRFEFQYENLLSEKLMINVNETESLCKQLFLEIQNQILVFDSIRSFDRMESDFYKNGSELINWLHQGASQAEIKNVRQKVRVWLKNFFNLDEPVSVKADKEKKRLIFTFDDMEFSSDEVGTGYTMLYILLAEIVRNKKEFIIIDEIESHLQPGLVRLLINLVREFGNAQYIIATHSSTVLESANAKDILYRFSKTGGVCTCENFFRNAGGIAKLREVCNELGVVPGDALLSNTVIWVEGPSEMFWLRAWLKNYFPIYKDEHGIECNLIEGLHFSILMTGGSNIAHYGFQEGEVPVDLIEEEELLKVLKINPNPLVIIDSDNTGEGTAKFQRMIRIAKELNEINKTHPKFKEHFIEEICASNFSEVVNLWVLKGRELENYAHPQLLKDFYTARSSYPASKITGVESCQDWDVFDSQVGAGNILEVRGLTNVAKSSGTLIHKNDFARFVFRKLEPIHFQLKNDIGMEEPNQDMLEDLTKSLDKIISYIIKVNGIKQRSSIGV